MGRIPDPLVSVLTPSFEQVAWLADNLRSVACQTYPHIEHVVMDGGSTDGSVELLREADGSVVWRSEADAGQADAINKAFAASSGEIVGWVNSDDAYFDSRVVEDAVAFFAAHADIDVVYGHGMQITPDGAAIQLLWAPPFGRDLLRAVDFITQPTAFVRRSAIEPPMLDASFHFALDYELWLRLESAGKRFARLNRIVAVDRHQPDRKSLRIKGVHESDLGRLRERYDLPTGPEWDDRRSSFYREQRLRGALLIPRVRQPLAFTAPERLTSGLLRRQVLTRRRDWPEEYR